MNLRKMFLSGFFVFFFLYFIFPFRVLGAPLESFSATALLPISQKNQKIGYFDLELKEQQNKKISVRVTNQLNSELTVTVAFQRAQTTNLGTVFYEKVGEEAYLAEPDIEDYVFLSDRELILAPLATQIVTLELKMPKESFEGVLAGGIVLKEKKPKQEANRNIHYRYSREIALLLKNSEKIPSPKLAVNDLKIKKNQIQFSVENQARLYLKETKLTYFLINEKQQVFKETDVDFKIAPQTSFVKKIELPQKLSQDNYQLSMIVESEGQRPLQITYPFTVNGKIKKENKKLRKKQYLPFISFLFLLPFIFIFLKRPHNK